MPVGSIITFKVTFQKSDTNCWSNVSVMPPKISFSYLDSISDSRKCRSFVKRDFFKLSTSLLTPTFLYSVLMKFFHVRRCDPTCYTAISTSFERETPFQKSFRAGCWRESRLFARTFCDMRRTSRSYWRTLTVLGGKDGTRSFRRLTK